LKVPEFKRIGAGGADSAWLLPAPKMVMAIITIASIEIHFRLSLMNCSSFACCTFDGI
jgi:hypothetical protein